MLAHGLLGGVAPHVELAKVDDLAPHRRSGPGHRARADVESAHDPVNDRRHVKVLQLGLG